MSKKLFYLLLAAAAAFSLLCSSADAEERNTEVALRYFNPYQYGCGYGFGPNGCFGYYPRCTYPFRCPPPPWWVW